MCGPHVFVRTSLLPTLHGVAAQPSGSIRCAPLRSDRVGSTNRGSLTLSCSTKASARLLGILVTGVESAACKIKGEEEEDAAWVAQVNLTSTGKHSIYYVFLAGDFFFPSARRLGKVLGAILHGRCRRAKAW